MRGGARRAGFVIGARMTRYHSHESREHLEGDAPAVSKTNRKRNAVAFAGVFVLWLAVDVATKLYFNSGQFFVGEHIAGPFFGLFEFLLVHNTGAAWGMFGDSTFALAIVSLVVCAVLLVYLFVFSPHAGLGQTIGLALVCSGGIGNAIDRFTQGYVVDFINVSFMDFPVFNIADIGVTCGFVVFFISLLFFDSKEES